MVKTTAKRPLIWASASFMAGIVGGVYAAKSGDFALAVVIMLISAAAFALITYKKLRYIAVVSAFCIATAFFCTYFSYNSRTVVPFADREGSVSATIIEINKKTEDYTRYEACNVIINGEKVNSNILITVNGSSSFLPGDQIAFDGKLLLPKETRNSGVFDYRSYLADEGVLYVTYINSEDITVYEENSDISLTSFIRRSRELLIEQYSHYLSSDALGIISSVSLGDKIYLDEETSSLYRISGTAHLLAISGLHVGFIVLILSFLTGRLKKKRILYFVINMVFVWIYIFFTGASVSAIRAGIFFALFSLGSALHMRRDVTNTAFTAALIMLIFKPMLLFSVSFQLSFAAALGIGLLSPKMRRFLEKKLSFPTNAANNISAIITAGISVLPVIAYHFNTMSLVSVIANAIIVPLFSYIMIFSVLLPLTLFINVPFIINAVAAIINGLVFIVKSILTAISSFEFASLTVASPNVVILISIFVIFLLLSVEKPRNIHHKIVGITVALFVIVVNIIIPFTGISGIYDVSFIDVGQAECTLIRTPFNKTVMIDAGTSYGTDGTAEYTIVPYILKHGNTVLDYLILSHPHSDHIGEASEVLNNITVNNLVLYYPEDNVPEEYAELMQTAHSLGINVINMMNVCSISVDRSTSFSSVSKYYSDSDVNSDSLVLKVSCGNNNLLFAGDMAAEGLDEIEDVDRLLIYKVAHHGSKSGISNRIAKLSPAYSVICTKAGNSYNLPSNETVSYLEEFSTVLKTEDLGEINFRFSDKKVAISGFFH